MSAPGSLVAAMALALLGGCASDTTPAADNPAGVVISTGDQGPYSGAELATPMRWPAATLTDTEGDDFTLGSDTASPVTLVFFGYTNCPDICPLTMANIASAVSRLEPDVRAKVQTLFITTDPARDDAATLRAWLDRFDPSFEGLTGDLATIKRVAAALGVEMAGATKLASGGYDVGHGSQIIGFVGDTAPVVWTQGTSVGALTGDITLLAQPA